MFAFNEKQNFTLAAPLHVDITQAGVRRRRVARALSAGPSRRAAKRVFLLAPLPST
jgi:hypothetical protein